MNITIRHEATGLCLLDPDEEGREWLRENVDPEAIWFAGSLMVEPRYVHDIVWAFQEAGGSLSRGES